MAWSALPCSSGYSSRGWDHFIIFIIPHTLYILGMTWAHVVPLTSCWVPKLFPLWYQCVEWLQLQLNPKPYSSVLVVQQHPQAEDILCAFERCRPQTERIFLVWSLLLQVWGTRMVCHDQGWSLAKRNVHTVASDMTLLSHTSLAPLLGFGESCSGLLAYLGKYSGFGGLGPPACLMCFCSLVSALAEEQAILSYFIHRKTSSS